MDLELGEAEAHVKRTTVRLPEGLHESVDLCARAAGMSFNAAVTAALIDFVSSAEHRTRVTNFFQEGLERHRAFLEKIGS